MTFLFLAVIFYNRIVIFTCGGKMEKISSEELIAAVESCSEIVKTEIDRVTADSRAKGPCLLPCGAKGLTVMILSARLWTKEPSWLWWKNWCPAYRPTGRWWCGIRLRLTAGSGHITVPNSRER